MLTVVIIFYYDSKAVRLNLKGVFAKIKYSENGILKPKPLIVLFGISFDSQQLSRIVI